MTDQYPSASGSYRYDVRRDADFDYYVHVMGTMDGSGYFNRQYHCVDPAHHKGWLGDIL